MNKMDNNELLQKALKHYAEASQDARDDKVLLHIPTMMADFALEMYEAGQRAERVRIVFELDELLGDVGDGKLARFMDELRADPAESGE